MVNLALYPYNSGYAKAQTRLAVLVCRILELLVQPICDCFTDSSFPRSLTLHTPAHAKCAAGLYFGCRIRANHCITAIHTQSNSPALRAMPRRPSDMSSSPTDDSKTRHGKMTKKPLTGTSITRLPLVAGPDLFDGWPEVIPAAPSDSSQRAGYSKRLVAALATCLKATGFTSINLAFISLKLLAWYQDSCRQCKHQASRFHT